MQSATSVEARGERQAKHSPARVPELDGVRALAVWLVLLGHLIAPDERVIAIVRGLIPAPLLQIVSHGWMGVDLFFVLSGFLITGILLDSKSRSGYFHNFYVRRVFRIFPLYFGTILVFWLFYGYGRYFLLSALFLANMGELLNIPVPHGPGVYWSLAVEEHFYIFWPLIVRLLSRRWLMAVCAAICLIEPFVRMATTSAGMNFYGLTWCRLDGLATGAALAIWFRSGRATRRNSLLLAGGMILAMAAISLAGIPYGINSPRGLISIAFRGTQGDLAFGAFLCAVYALRASRLTAVLRWRFLTLSGEISYCLYLVHLALADGYDVFFAKYPALHSLSPQAALFLRAVCVAGLSWLLAILSRRFFDGPILAQKERFTVKA